MLALNGNTAPYLQYAYARIRSIFRKADAENKVELENESALTPSLSPRRGGMGFSAGERSKVSLNEPAEIALARHLLNFGLVLEAVTEEYRPNYLCNYLYELAGHFARFYENCPVLKAEPAERASRLVLCDLTAKVLKQGLEVLGIETLEQM
jgi:arginyl-tRNA synthetase